MQMYYRKARFTILQPAFGSYLVLKVNLTGFNTFPLLSRKYKVFLLLIQITYSLLDSNFTGKTFLVFLSVKYG